MSCQFKAYAKFDVEDLRNQLHYEEISDGGGVRHNGSTSTSKDITNNRGPSFLSRCSVSFSPGGDFLVVAHKRSLCILSAKWDSNEEEDVKTKFKTIVTHNPCHNESEEITAAICLPLIMPSKSVRVAHTSEQTDWTCIVLGFNSGYVRFYDEGGDLLLSELVFEEPVQYIKCQSYNPSKTLSHDDNPEELYVTFESTVAIIPGFALFQTLRACRNQLARVKANYAEHVAPPPLALKKWTFIDQDRLRDCEVVGPSSSDMFDHLMTASIGGGFNARYRSGAPKSTLLVAAGRGPFVGFHYALDGVEGRSVLTDVAQVVKSKFKGFFFGSSNDRQKNSGTIEPPENLACRFGLCDFNREGDHIVRSPNREYAVVTDALGRVTLVNNFRGIAIRMWKGYRKAQCGWLQVEEEEPSVKGNPKHLLRSVLFLVIYDPKKGMLEVWTVPNGIRIASFCCSKKGRLLYTSHGLVGLSSASGAWVNKSVLPCVFMDPDGIIFQISVPFHCALSDATSERAADLALLRKLKSTLKGRHLEDEQLAQEVGLLAAELKTAEVCKQILVTLTSNRHVTVDTVEAALAVFMDRSWYLEKSCSENTWQNLFLSMQQLRNLLSFYKFVDHERERPPNYSLVVPQEGISDLEAMCDVLSVSDQELTALKSLISSSDLSVGSLSSQKREPRVTFNENTSSGSSLADFLACFDFGKKAETSVAPNAVAVKKLPPAKMNLLAELLFQGILYNDVPMEMWQAEAACSGILPSNLLLLAVHFWLLRNAGKALEVEMIRFAQIIKAICLLEEVNSCDLSSFWSLVRTSLAESTQPFNALTAALVCRAVACSLEKQGFKKHSKSPTKAKKSPTVNGPEVLQENDPSRDNAFIGSPSLRTESQQCSNEWEDVSWDSVKWNLLIGRLEDIALLNQILSQNPADLCEPSSKSTLPCLRYTKPSLSLSNILQKGKGAISEQVAKWLTASGMDPKLLIDGSDIEWMEKNAGIANSPTPLNVDEPQPEDKSEVTVREGIPLMTEKGTEASQVFTSHAPILDKICLLRKHFPYSMCGSVLLANVSWEYLLEWHKNPEQINILQAANTCLQIIPNIHVRQGLSSLIWSSHLKQRFEIATRIINESKGNPKEKLCRKDLQMSESHLADFAEACLKFLELFIEATNMSEVMHQPGPGSIVNRCEDIWDYDEEMAVASTPSLTGLALAQSATSYEHLELLHQLVLTVHMSLSLGLRGQQLTPLFKPGEWALFFSDSPSDTSKIGLEPSEPHLSSKRTQFLMFAVSSAMHSVLSSDPVHVNDLSGGVMSDMKTAMKWFGLCQHLAYTWQISVDPIRRHQVCLLYSTGHDRLAEEILTAVNEVDLLAKQLLLICGQRLKVIMDHSLDLEEKISNLDPFLSAYLYELRTNEVREVSITDTALLATHVVQHLPENDPEHPLAVSLFDALQALSTC